MVEIVVEDPGSADALACLDAYADELAARIPGGFDPRASLLADPRALDVFLVARRDGEPVGCGGLRGNEVKRVWVAGKARGEGLARRLVAELEAHARTRGLRTLRLDTNRALVEAIAMYRKDGWVEVPPFNTEPYAHHWFEKSLGPVVDSGGDRSYRG